MRVCVCVHYLTKKTSNQRYAKRDAYEFSLSLSLCLWSVIVLFLVFNLQQYEGISKALPFNLQAITQRPVIGSRAEEGEGGKVEYWGEMEEKNEINIGG